MTLIVFATNIKPADLADEAFLRRIQYKIFAESPTLEEFMRIFENYCRDRSVEFDRSLIERMLREYYRPRELALRGCHPRDLDRARAVTGRLPGTTAIADLRAARSSVRQLFR